MKSQKKKPSAKSKTKATPAAKKEKKAAQKKKVIKIQVPGVGSVSFLEGYDPTYAIKLMVRTCNYLPKWPLRRQWRVFDPNCVEDRLSLGLVNVYEREPASYGYYEEARVSADAATKKTPPINHDDVPLPLDEIPTTSDPESLMDAKVEVEAFKTAYFAEHGDWLKGCRNAILAAVDAGDEKFFLRLVALIRDRPKIRGQSMLGHSLMREDDPLPKCRTDVWRRTIAEHWVEWPLWLMSDAVGCDYLNKFQTEKMSEANYKKIRQQLGLFQHPERPINNFTDEGKPLIRPGWKFPKS